MKKSTVSTLALGVLVAGALAAGTAAAQTGTPVGTPGVLINNQSTTTTTIGTPLQSGMPTGGAMMVSPGPNMAMGGNTMLNGGIGPGMQGGAGAPTDGLDVNPYRDASPQVQAATRGMYGPHAQTRAGVRASGSSTTN